MSNCKSCHARLPADARADAVYCSDACRQRDYRRRKKAGDRLRLARHEIARHAEWLRDDATNRADLDELRAAIIAIARTCHEQLRKTDTARGRFVDTQERLPD